MVFSLSPSSPETPPPTPSQRTMAPSTPFKPQQQLEQQQQPPQPQAQLQQALHNFALPELKWAAMSSPFTAGRHRKQSDPTSPAVTEAEEEPEEKKLAEAAEAEEDGKSRFVIRLKTKGNKVAEGGDRVSVVGGNEVVEEEAEPEAEEEPAPKTWNFRPRNLVTKPNASNNSNGSGGALRFGGTGRQESRATDDKAKKKKKPSISLTKEEIEEDFLAMTGSKPARRPQRRPKNVQKELDYLFPGMFLHRVTPDTYKVNEAQPRLKM